MPNVVRDVSRSRAITSAQIAAALHRATVAADLAEDDSAGLDAALTELGDGLDGAFAAALVLDHDRLWLASTSRYAMVADGLALDEGVVGRAVRTGEPQFVGDVEADTDYVVSMPATVCQLAVPLSVEGRLVGVLSVESAVPLAQPPALALSTLGETLARRLDGLRTTRPVDLAMLARLFVYISSLRDPDAIGEVSSRALARILPMDTSQVAVVDEAGRLVDASSWRASDEGPEPLGLDLLDVLRERLDGSTVFDVVDGSSAAGFGAGIRSVVVLPLRANGSEIGLLVGTSRFGRDFERHQIEAAALLAAHAAASLDAAFALARERTTALTDPLTGLLNRRGFDMRLERELEAAQDERRPVSVLILDCDDFKEVNDRAGHEFGDALLKEMGDVLTATVGSTACVARLGGDEFVIMLPDADGDVAAETANGIRDRLAVGISDAGFPMRVSGGVATYPYDGAMGSQLLRGADQALYEAKARGKNTISTFRDVVRVGTEPEVPGSRPRGRSSSATLADAADAADSIWGEQTADTVLVRLGKSLTFVVGATGCTVSRLIDGMLVDASSHSLRDTTLGDAAAYQIDDFPFTKAVLEERRPRAISFLDDDLDRSEAFVLRELGMNCVLLLPIVVAGATWGLAEVFDMRLRSYGPEEIAVGEFLVGQAGRRLETFPAEALLPHALPVFRLPE
jgi:diguanylate cyclase (GGDEF)-like protein